MAKFDREEVLAFHKGGIPGIGGKIPIYTV